MTNEFRKSPIILEIANLSAAGQVDEAETLLNTKQASLSTPEFNECQGILHYYREEFQLAIERFEFAMGFAHYDCARYHYLLGAKAQQAGDWTSACTRFQAAITIEPTFVDSYIDFGGLLLDAGHFEEALECYKDAAKLCPSEIGIRRNIVHVLHLLATPDRVKYLFYLTELAIAKKILESLAANPA